MSTAPLGNVWANLITHPQHVVDATLAAPPFLAVDGVINIREFSGCPSALRPASVVRPRTLFRSGEPNRISARGVEALRVLGVKTVFDLRADVEIATFQTASASIEGVRVVRAPVGALPLDPEGLAQRMKLFESNEAEAFIAMYDQILQLGARAAETVFLHLRDHSDEPCLLHCTAGKDRTGVFAALILSVLGASEEDIVKDYVLTAIGLQPAIPLLAARFEKEQVYRDNIVGTVNMGSARAETMRSLLNHLREKYGGAEGYLKANTRLTEGDLARIRANLVVPAVGVVVSPGSVFAKQVIV